MPRKPAKERPNLNYHPAKNCYLLFTSKSSPSIAHRDITPLKVSQVQEKFKFNLLCEDVVKTVREAKKLKKKYHLDYCELPAPLEHYTIEKNVLNLFVVYKISEQIGYGVYTYAALKPGRLIAEYVGELKVKGAMIDHSYLFIKEEDGGMIDSQNYGNIARFFSHCPSEHHDKRVLTANVACAAWKVSEKESKAFFFTIRNIKAGEPICWDYGSFYPFPEGIQYLDANAPYKPLPTGLINDEL